MNRTHLRGVGLPMAALIIAGLMSFAQPTAAAAEAPVLADATVYAGGVSFRPYVEFRRANITVSGNGQIYRQAFNAGEDLEIGMFDPQGNPLADGAYTWSLELVPDMATARELRISASANGGKAPDAWQVLTGTFTIARGAMAEPELAEAEPVRPGRTQTATGPGAVLRSGGLRGSGGTSEDDDSRVGSQAGFEAQMNARSGQLAPARVSGGMQPPDRSASEDTDATSTAMGQTLEPSTASPDNQLSARRNGPSAPRPRSDGSNGRPRSDG